MATSSEARLFVDGQVGCAWHNARFLCQERQGADFPGSRTRKTWPVRLVDGDIGRKLSISRIVPLLLRPRQQRNINITEWRLA